jgi:hypothetical protein
VFAARNAAVSGSIPQEGLVIHVGTTDTSVGVALCYFKFFFNRDEVMIRGC